MQNNQQKFWQLSKIQHGMSLIPERENSASPDLCLGADFRTRKKEVKQDHAGAMFPTFASGELTSQFLSSRNRTRSRNLYGYVMPTRPGEPEPTLLEMLSQRKQQAQVNAASSHRSGLLVKLSSTLPSVPTTFPTTTWRELLAATQQLDASKLCSPAVDQTSPSVAFNDVVPRESEGLHLARDFNVPDATWNPQVLAMYATQRKQNGERKKGKCGRSLFKKFRSRTPAQEMTAAKPVRSLRHSPIFLTERYKMYSPSADCLQAPRAFDPLIISPPRELPQCGQRGGEECFPEDCPGYVNQSGKGSGRERGNRGTQFDEKTSRIYEDFDTPNACPSTVNSPSLRRSLNEMEKLSAQTLDCTPRSTPWFHSGQSASRQCKTSPVPEPKCRSHCLCKSCTVSRCFLHLQQRESDRSCSPSGISPRISRSRRRWNWRKRISKNVVSRSSLVKNRDENNPRDDRQPPCMRVKSQDSCKQRSEQPQDSYISRIRSRSICALKAAFGYSKRTYSECDCSDCCLGRQSEELLRIEDLSSGKSTGKLTSRPSKRKRPRLEQNRQETRKENSRIRVLLPTKPTLNQSSSRKRDKRGPVDVRKESACLKALSGSALCSGASAATIHYDCGCKSSGHIRVTESRGWFGKKSLNIEYRDNKLAARNKTCTPNDCSLQILPKRLPSINKGSSENLKFIVSCKSSSQNKKPPSKTALLTLQSSDQLCCCPNTDNDNESCKQFNTGKQVKKDKSKKKGKRLSCCGGKKKVSSPYLKTQNNCAAEENSNANSSSKRKDRRAFKTNATVLQLQSTDSQIESTGLPTESSVNDRSLPKETTSKLKQSAPSKKRSTVSFPKEEAPVAQTSKQTPDRPQRKRRLGLFGFWKKRPDKPKSPCRCVQKHMGYCRGKTYCSCPDKIPGTSKSMQALVAEIVSARKACLLNSDDDNVFVGVTVTPVYQPIEPHDDRLCNKCAKRKPRGPLKPREHLDVRPLRRNDSFHHDCWDDVVEPSDVRKWRGVYDEKIYYPREHSNSKRTSREDVRHRDHEEMRQRNKIASSRCRRVERRHHHDPCEDEDRRERECSSRPHRRHQHHEDSRESSREECPIRHERYQQYHLSAEHAPKECRRSERLMSHPSQIVTVVRKPEKPVGRRDVYVKPQRGGDDYNTSEGSRPADYVKRVGHLSESHSILYPYDTCSSFRTLSETHQPRAEDPCRRGSAMMVPFSAVDHEPHDEKRDQDKTRSSDSEARIDAFIHD